MAYTYELFAGTDRQEAIFRDLYDQSYPEFEKGNWDWRMAFLEEFHNTPKGEVDRIKNYEEKFIAFRKVCQNCFDLKPNDCWPTLVYKDDVPIQFILPVRNDKHYRVTIIISLNGKDSEGSRSWLYDKEFKMLNMSFCRDFVGAREHSVVCVENSPTHKHYSQISGDNNKGTYSWYIEKSEKVHWDPTITLVDIVFRYPTVEEIPPLDVLPWRTND